MLNDLDTVALTRDLPEAGLVAGDVGAVVHVYGAGAAFEVEFVDLKGETIALVTLPPEALRPVAPREIAHARAVA